MRRIRTDIRGSGVPFIVLAGGCGYGPSRDHRLNDFSSKNYEPEFFGRTCVCLTDDPGTHAEKKGPVPFYGDDFSEGPYSHGHDRYRSFIEVISRKAGYGWLIRATGSMLLRYTPTSRSRESKTVPDQQRGNAIAVASLIL